MEIQASRLPARTGPDGTPVLLAGRLGGHPPLAAVRGDLLARRGRDSEAAAESRRADALTRNTRERDLYLARATGGGQPRSR